MLRVIQLLEDGEFHSGEALGKHLNLTRSAVWKLIKQLSNWGIEIESRTGKGYRIPQGLTLLNKTLIQNFIQSPQLHKIDEIEIFLSLPSTSDYLIAKPKETFKNCICLAERQTQGRGRRGRQWTSPFATNLYLSLLWHWTKDVSELSGLSLVLSLSLLQTLKQFGITEHIGLKWPNDILWKNKEKLAGILIELTGESHNISRTVIGIGLNTAMPKNNTFNITQPYTDMQTITQQLPDRNQLAGVLLNELIKTISIFQEQGFAPFIQEWKKHDLTFAKSVSITTPTLTLQGIGRGINHKGDFLLETSDKMIHSFSMGEVSLRLIEKAKSLDLQSLS